MLIKIRFDLQSSFQLNLLLNVIHGGAILSVFFTNLHWLIQCSLILVCLFNLIKSHYQSSKWKTIFYLPHEGWELQDKYGESYKAYLLGNSIRSRWIVILNYRIINTYFPISIVIFPDRMIGNSFYRLRFYLLNLRQGE